MAVTLHDWVALQVTFRTNIECDQESQIEQGMEREIRKRVAQDLGNTRIVIYERVEGGRGPSARKFVFIVPRRFAAISEAFVKCLDPAAVKVMDIKISQPRYGTPIL